MLGSHCVEHTERAILQSHVVCADERLHFEMFDQIVQIHLRLFAFDFGAIGRRTVGRRTEILVRNEFRRQRARLRWPFVYSTRIACFICTTESYRLEIICQN